MKQRFLFIVSLLLVATMVLVSCGPATETTEAPTQAPPVQPTAVPQKITLLWGFWGSPAEKASHERVAQAYMQEHPNVQFEYMFAPSHGHP
jgi:multiple sugar transport system substrate-binding protein